MMPESTKTTICVECKHHRLIRISAGMIDAEHLCSAFEFTDFITGESMPCLCYFYNHDGHCAYFEKATPPPSISPTGHWVSEGERCPPAPQPPENIKFSESPFLRYFWFWWFGAILLAVLLSWIGGGI